MKLSHIFPFLDWWPLVSPKTLKADFLAGITGAVIVLPQGVAFAMIAGLPPEYGLYTAMITPIIAALFGSSRHLISGPTTAISLVVFASLSPLAEPGSLAYIQLALTLAFMAGVIQLILGLVRMGSLVNFVSHSVVTGFTAGAAILIITSQLKHILGIEIGNSSSFINTWTALFLKIGQTNVYALGIGIGSLAAGLLLKRFAPKLPYLLLAMVIGGLISYFVDGASHGVALVGKLPAHLPLPSLPQLSPPIVKGLAGKAFAIGLLGLIEAVAIAKAIASHTQQRIDGNQEFIGQGLSNIVGSFFSCYPGSGSFTRSGVNHQAGAQTPLAAIFAAILLALILLLVAPITAYLPIPAMGGIIIWVGYNLIDFHFIRLLVKTDRTEFVILAITFFATLFLELELAIYLGVIFSLIFYLQKTAQPRIVELAPNPESPRRQFVNIKKHHLADCPQLMVIRIDGSLYFGAIENVSTQLKELQEAKPEALHLLIVAEGINFLDLSGAELLGKEAFRRRKSGGDLFVAGLKQTSREMMEKAGYWEEIGEDHFFSSKQVAIRHIYPLLSQQICQSCTHRIFTECRKATLT